MKLFLQSRDEFDALPEDIKIPTDKTGRPDWVWLRSQYLDYPNDEDKMKNWADAGMRIGKQIYYGNPIRHRGCGVRPCVKVNSDIDPTMKIGDSIMLGTDLDGDGLEWICIGDHIIITKLTLFYSDFDETTNIYKESKLRAKLAEIENQIFDETQLSFLSDTEY